MKLYLSLVFIFMSTTSMASPQQCADILSPRAKAPQQLSDLQVFHQAVRDSIPFVIEQTKTFAVDKALDILGFMKGLPKYLKTLKELIKTESYLKYRNFGEMGLAEIGISVRVNQSKLQALDTGKPLIIIANHPLGIADGLSVQYLSSLVRKDKPSLLMLARWIEKLLPTAVYSDGDSWGTAIPVEINKPLESDPDYEAKMTEVNAFNSKWSRTTLKTLRGGAAVIIFPAGQVAAMNLDEGSYPDNVYDAANSWQAGLLNLARLGKADIVFANVDSVNSESFYKNRKRFGGGDKERVIWFFSEALAKENKAIDIYFSDPLSLDRVYETLSQTFEIAEDDIKSDDQLATELMRIFTHDISNHFPQELNHTKSPERVK